MEEAITTITVSEETTKKGGVVAGTITAIKMSIFDKLCFSCWPLSRCHSSHVKFVALFFPGPVLEKEVIGPLQIRYGHGRSTGLPYGIIVFPLHQCHLLLRELIVGDF